MNCRRCTYSGAYNKFLSATLNTTLKYDNDVKTFEDNGEKRGAKVQFKEILGIGVAYNF